jgi:PAS domain S-box-containing protein
MKDFASRYEELLHRYVASGEEEALGGVYQLARAAVADGTSLLELAAVHRSAAEREVEAASREEKAIVSKLAADFLSETLAPFELTYGGLREFGKLERSKAKIAETERRRAQAALQASERNYRLLFEGSPAPMFFSDADTRTILEVNQAAVDTYGYSRVEFAQMTGQDIFVPKPTDEAAQGQGSREAGDVVRYGPVSHRTKDGRLIEVLLTSFLVEYGGRPARFSLVEDVTEKLKLEVQYQQAQRLESLGQLAGGVAHDFNNLLGVVLNFALFLKETLSRAATEPGGERWQPALKDSERIIRAAESATRLTHQLLAFARREVVRPRALNINSVIGEIEPLLRRTLGEHIDFVTSLAPTLQPIMIDPGQLEQVITNLSVNARDAMTSGGTLTIDTDNIEVDDAYAAGRPGLKPGRYVMLRVTDTGQGMDRPTLQRAFEPFFTTKPKGQGTGLGLATVHGIVNQAGGYVAIYSEPGLGTRVNALFPVTEERPRHPESGLTAASDAATETILVVEDDADLREVVVRILERNGYSVIQASSGPDAIAAASVHAGHIDMLLTDVVMPHMHGKELAQRIGRSRPGLKVLFMSGYAQPMLDASGTLEAGVVLLEKPFTEPTLLSLVRRVLETRA